ncbi:Rex4p [Gigaspora margarita]|uniref:Rex4p n=1 Tax=Gigaspora margarita TaxID=4874 RepID=A0A8H4EL49_GIGMA|nr:Rex4p [Gigaspora margarita]
MVSVIFEINLSVKQDVGELIVGEMTWIQLCPVGKLDFQYYNFGEVLASTVTSVTTNTHQVCPTLPPCSSSNIQDPNAYISLDCEFIHIGPPGESVVKTEVSQVAIVDYDGNVLLNSYVRPVEPKSHWRTHRDYLYINAPSPAEMRSEVYKIIEGRIIVGFEMINDLLGLEIDHPLSLLRDISLCHKYRRMSLAAAVQIELKRNIQQNLYHDAIEDASITMELFRASRVNRDFENEMIPTRDYKKPWLTRTSETSVPTLASCPTAPTNCLPPLDEFVALNIMSVLIGSGRKRGFIPLQVTLVDYEHNVVLNGYIRQDITDLQTKFTGITREIYDAKDDHENDKLRELQRSPPIRFNPIYRNKPPSLDVLIENEFKISLLDNGLPSSIRRAIAIMRLYQKYKGEDELMIPLLKIKSTTQKATNTF